MHHEIHDDVDVERSRSERAHPMRFKESRFGDPPAKRYEGRIETLDVSHLQRQASCFGDRDHFISFGYGSSNRLLDKDMNSRFEAPPCDLVMAYGRSGDADRFDPTDEIDEVPHTDDAKSLRYRLAGCFVDVAHGHQFDVFERRVDASMLLPEVTYADDRSFQPVCHLVQIIRYSRIAVS